MRPAASAPPCLRSCASAPPAGFCHGRRRKPPSRRLGTPRRPPPQVERAAGLGRYAVSRSLWGAPRRRRPGTLLVLREGVAFGWKMRRRRRGHVGIRRDGRGLAGASRDLPATKGDRERMEALSVGVGGVGGRWGSLTKFPLRDFWPKISAGPETNSRL
jgi:hypothetical protein